jgi:hypothetical protein
MGVLLMTAAGGTAALLARTDGPAPGSTETFDPAETRADASPLLTAEPLAQFAPALDATADTIGQDPALWQVRATSGLAVVTVHVPGVSDELEEYTWRDGELSSPSPRDHFLTDPSQLDSRLFTRADVDTDTIADVLAAVPELDPITSGDDVQLYPTGVAVSYDLAHAAFTLTVNASENVVDSDFRFVANFDLDGELLSTFEVETGERTEFD